MAKTLTSAIGVDLGRYALKSVLLQKKGGRVVMTDCASHTVDDAVKRTPEELGRQIKALFKQLGGGAKAKACAVAVSSPEALLRIVDQQDTPPELLRDAMRLNGLSLFNQDCRDYVIDCDFIQTQQPITTEFGAPQQKRYLVAGLPRQQVDTVGKLIAEHGALASIQLTPVSLFNAFEFAQPEVFASQAFFLLDFGHTSSTMIMGSKRELVLIRNIEFGGRTLVDTLASLSGESPATVIKTLENEDELMIENARLALNAITREIGSSIGFFEGRHEETVGQVWVSGGLAKSKSLLRLLTEELRLPCQAWSAAEKCEVALPASKRAQFTEQMTDFSVACGAATQLLIA